MSPIEHQLLVSSVLTLANIDCGFINRLLHPSVYDYRTRDEKSYK